MNIEKALDRFLPQERTLPRRLHEAMRYSVFSGGKRIRPAILILAAEACGGKGVFALPLACSVEFIHTYSLIHDDLPAMDDDDYRRGKPSCHKVFGEATAILAGDGLLTLAFETVAKNYPPDIAKEAIVLLAAAAGSRGMVGGQEMDLAGSGGRRKAGIDALKTAKLFEVSAVLGAVSAGAGKKKKSALGEYGRNLGLAFQIADDIADSEGYSRPSGRDKARREAAKLIKRAKDIIRIPGMKTRPLEKIADEVYANAA
jgi:geranylgeranyl diphosphate synthase type II